MFLMILKTVISCLLEWRVRYLMAGVENITSNMYNYLYDRSLIYGILIKAVKIKLFMPIETEKRK